MAYLPVPARMLDDMEIRLSNIIKQEGIHTRNTIVQEQGKTRRLIEDNLCTVNQTIHTFAGHIKNLNAEFRINSPAQRAREQANKDHLIKKTEARLCNLNHGLSDIQYSLSHISVDIFELDQSCAHNGLGISSLERDMEILLNNTCETDSLLGEVIARLSRQEPTAPASPCVSDSLCDLIGTKSIGDDAELVWTNEKEVLSSRKAAIASTKEKIHESGCILCQLVDIAPVESEYGSDGSVDREDVDGEGYGDEASNDKNSDGEITNFDTPSDFARDEATLRDRAARKPAPEVLHKPNNPPAATMMPLVDSAEDNTSDRTEDWINVPRFSAWLRTNQFKDFDEEILTVRNKSPTTIEAPPQQNTWEVKSSSSSETFPIPDTSTDDSPKPIQNPPSPKTESTNDQPSEPWLRSKCKSKPQTQAPPEVEVTQPAKHQTSLTLGRGRPDARESERRRVLRAATLFDVSLPRGWEVRTSETEEPYYIDHATRGTTWVRPIMESEGALRET